MQDRILDTSVKKSSYVIFDDAVVREATKIHTYHLTVALVFRNVDLSIG